jgi:hypothetical protein
MTLVEAFQITTRYEFQQRVRMCLIIHALYLLIQETPATADVLLGQRVLNDTEALGTWYVAVVTFPAILAGAHGPDGSTILDSEIQSAIQTYWPAFRL